MAHDGVHLLRTESQRLTVAVCLGHGVFFIIPFSSIGMAQNGIGENAAPFGVDETDDGNTRWISDVNA